jgi:hypothetical protein
MITDIATTTCGQSQPTRARTVHPTVVMSRLTATARPILATGDAEVGTRMLPHHHPGRMKSSVTADSAWRASRGW